MHDDPFGGFVCCIYCHSAFSQVFKAKYYRDIVCVKRIKPKANESSTIQREITLLKCVSFYLLFEVLIFMYVGKANMITWLS